MVKNSDKTEKGSRGFKHAEIFYCSKEDLEHREYWTARPTKTYIDRTGRPSASSRRYKVTRYFEEKPYKYQP